MGDTAIQVVLTDVLTDASCWIFCPSVSFPQGLAKLKQTKRKIKYGSNELLLFSHIPGQYVSNSRSVLFCRNVKSKSMALNLKSKTCINVDKEALLVNE